MVSTVDRVRVVYEAEVSKFKSNVTSATKTMDNFSKDVANSNSKVANSFSRLTPMVKGFIGAFAVGSIVNFTSKLTKQVDQMDKLAKRLGTTTEALSQLKFVAEQNGVAFNTFSMAMQRMVRRVAEAARGTGEAKDAIAELGFNAQLLNQLPLDKQFELIADSLSRLESDADKVRLAFKLFDAEGVRVLQTMGGGADGIREMRKQADKLGLTLKQDTVNEIVRAKDEIHKLTSFLESQAIRTMGDMAAAVNFFATEISNGAKAILDLTGKMLGMQKASNSIVQSLPTQSRQIPEQLQQLQVQNQPTSIFQPRGIMGQGLGTRESQIAQQVFESQPQSQPTFQDQGAGIQPVLRSPVDAENAMSRLEKTIKENEALEAEKERHKQKMLEIEKRTEEERQRVVDSLQGEIFSTVRDWQTKTKALEKASQKERIRGYTTMGMQILDTLSQDSETMFKITKALSLANAVVQTAEGVTYALRKNDFVTAGLTAAAGALQIAKISQTEFSGGTSVAGANAGGGEGQTQAIASQAQSQAQPQQLEQNISISGVNPSDILTGQQLSDLIYSINDQLDEEGVVLKSIRVV